MQHLCRLKKKALKKREKRRRDNKGSAMELEKKMKKVCVTGAGGFLASWAVKLLLSKGYIVHGTVRDPGDKKYAHLSKLDGASDNLKLFEADLLDYDSLLSALEGCAGVFHVACPVPSSTIADPEVEMLEPAVKGTLNVLRACSEMKVKRAVYVSSIAAIVMNPKWPQDRDMDETCWSDKEHCRTSKKWYYLSKTEAESAAFEYAKRDGLDVVLVCPGLIFGPLLQPTLNTSSAILLKLVRGGGGEDSVPNKLWMLVDVRDVAEAVITAYEKPEAEGRYICVAKTLTTRDLAEKLRSLFPGLTCPNKFHEARHENNVSSQRLKGLGWSCRPLDETLLDSIESYREAGFLG